MIYKENVMTLISDFALKKIQTGQRVSLGGGSNVADLTRAIAKANPGS